MARPDEGRGFLIIRPLNTMLPNTCRHTSMRTDEELDAMSPNVGVVVAPTPKYRKSQYPRVSADSFFIFNIYQPPTMLL
jgi:hypothetical protein